MISDTARSFLHRLLDTPGPSGFESAPARVWREEASSFASVRTDVAGNSIAEVNAEGSPTILLAGHIDEIGLIVTYIDDEGYVYVSGIGGWDPQVLVGQRLRFLGSNGDVIGVVGKKPIHLMKTEEREKAVKMTDIWVDVGAATRAETEERLAIGDAAVIDSRAVEFPNNRIISRSIDNRIGAFIVLETLRRYAERPGSAHVVAVATTQEEIATLGGGALVCATCVNPRMALVVDVTFATDHPNIEKKEIGEAKIGGGPVLTRGAFISPAVFKMVRSVAERLEMPYTVHAAGRDTRTDADAIHIAREGIATGLISVPNRYMHSPNEMVSYEDLDRVAELMAETCREVGVDTDFTAR
jgi:putative aminopeptidase FrvX